MSAGVKKMTNIRYAQKFIFFVGQMLNVVRTVYMRTKRKLYDKYVMTIVIDYMRAP